MSIHKRLWNWCRRPLKPVSPNFTRFVTPLFVSVLIVGLIISFILIAFVSIVFFVSNNIFESLKS